MVWNKKEKLFKSEKIVLVVLMVSIFCVNAAEVPGLPGLAGTEMQNPSLIPADKMRQLMSIRGALNSGNRQAALRRDAQKLKDLEETIAEQSKSLYIFDERFGKMARMFLLDTRQGTDYENVVNAAQHVSGQLGALADLLFPNEPQRDFSAILPAVVKMQEDFKAMTAKQVTTERAYADLLQRNAEEKRLQDLAAAAASSVVVATTHKTRVLSSLSSAVLPDVQRKLPGEHGASGGQEDAATGAELLFPNNHPMAARPSRTDILAPDEQMLPWLSLEAKRDWYFSGKGKMRTSAKKAAIKRMKDAGIETGDGEE